MNIAVQTRESSERAANAGEVEFFASSANHPVAHTLEPELISIDPRPCGLCGRTIDRHECIDDGEGPEFFCYPDGDLVKQWELADPRDRWKHTGEPPPDIGIPILLAKRSYRTPQSTVDAFFYVAALGDSDRLLRWLEQHAQDAQYLRKIANARA